MPTRTTTAPARCRGAGGAVREGRAGVAGKGARSRPLRALQNRPSAGAGLGRDVAPARLTLTLGLPPRALAGEAALLPGRRGGDLGLRGLERGADVLGHLVVALPAALLPHRGRGPDPRVGGHRGGC